MVNTLVDIVAIQQTLMLVITVLFTAVVMKRVDLNALTVSAKLHLQVGDKTISAENKRSITEKYYQT